MAQLIAHATAKDDLTRKDSKFRLIRMLYQRRYERQDILELFRYIDWMLQLPKLLEEQLYQAIEAMEQEEQMPYVTAIGRYAEVRGEAQTLRRQIQLKYNEIPDWVTDKINQADKSQLDQWVERILFEDNLDELFNP